MQAADAGTDMTSPANTHVSTNSRTPEVVSGNPKNPAEVLYCEHEGMIDRAVLRICRLSGLLPHHWEDAHSAARLGLWNAALRFDPGRGVAFATFAHWHIKGELSHYLRALERLREAQEVELDAPAYAGSPFALWKTLSDSPAERPGSALLAETGFESLVAALPLRQQACLRLLYQEDGQLTVLGEAWGVSRAAVSAMHLRALVAARRTYDAIEERESQ